MSITERKDWANDLLEKQKKDRAYLTTMGVNEKEIHKAVCCLGMVVDRCERMAENAKNDNKWMNDIEDAIQQLAKCKLPIPEGKKNPLSIIPKEEDMLKPEMAEGMFKDGTT